MTKMEKALIACEKVVEGINEYSLISIGINSKKETGTISIEVENVGTNNIFVKNVQVLLNYKTTKIEYSEKTGLIVGMSKKGESVHQEVDIYGRTLYSYGSSESGINEYKANNKYELLERSKDNLDRELKNTYQHLPQEHNLDNEGNYRVVKQEYKVENFYKESKASYSDGTWLKESEEDSEGNKINYSYDKAEQVVEVEGQGEKIGYKYGREGEIEEYQFKDYSNSLSYDESILKEISTKYKETKKDSVKYEYDPKGRLTKVIGENNIDYLNIEYSTEKNIVTSSKVGENITLFSYDNYERLSGINQKEGKYSYQYNYKDIYDLESIEDKVNEITYEYIKNYRDLKSREVVKDKNGKELSSILISKDYLSEQGNEKIVDRDLNSQISLVRGNIYYKGGEKTLYKEMIEQGYSVLSIIENYHALIGKEKALSPKSNICKNDSKKDYIKFIEPTKVSYTLNYKKGITLVFLLKGNKINVKVGTQISLNTNSESKLEVIKGTTIVEKSENSLSSGINVIGLTLSKEGYISVNEEVISLSGLSYSSIGVVEFNSGGKYGSIAIKEENIEKAYLEEILRHYKELSKEKIQNELGNKSPSEEHSLVYLTNKNKEKETIIIALDNSFETNNMRSPYHLNIDDSNFKMSKRELFRYEKELRRSMYIAEGNNLSYELNSVNIGTITLKIKPYLVRSNIERTIFAIGNDREEEIVVKQIGNKIRIDQNNRSYIVGKSNIETNKVNVISLSYALSIVSSGSSYGKNPDMKIRVRVNDIEDEVVFYDVEEFPTKLYMYVGIRGAGLKEPYYGQISDIRIRSKESSFNELKEYNKYSSPYEKQIVKDMIERPVIEYVVNRESKEIVRKKYSYQKEGIKDTNKIGREEIYVNNKSYINNEISYDEKQRVIKEGTREFTYTQEGYIKTDSKNSVSCEYDNLGNIVKKNEGGIEYTYKYLSNNRLKSVESNNKKINISYDESNPLYPSLIERSEGEKRKEIKLSYEWRRLSIVEIGTKKYLYKYDSLGQRVIKEEGNNKERYQYQDGRIKQVEKEGEYSLIYSYSSNGIIQSVSEISNKDIKTYFYLIDIIGNIVGLVDGNGNIVVEYDYSSMDLLVIDEISMVRADLLDAVDATLRRYRDREKPFGGVQLLMIGDLQQLAPVVKDNEWELLRKHYETPYFFASHALKETVYMTIELKKVYRQSDTFFLSLLNKIRENKADDEVLKKNVSKDFVNACGKIFGLSRVNTLNYPEVDSMTEERQKWVEESISLSLKLRYDLYNKQKKYYELVSKKHASERFTTHPNIRERREKFNVDVIDFNITENHYFDEDIKQYFDIANKYAFERSYKDALERYKKYNETKNDIDINDLSIVTEYAKTAFEYEVYDDAKKFARRALEIDPSLSRMNYILGWTLIMIDCDEEGVTYLKKVIDENEGDEFSLSAMQTLGDYYVETGIKRRTELTRRRFMTGVSLSFSISSYSAVEADCDVLPFSPFFDAP